ncbi:MAG: anti-sigma factor antagonist [Calditrichaeota bacterium]|nr:MAG: anti-sigma factor antagonist [Calditrichota bacterium]MBL1206360.1 anti-sigma factor antagonist [Calditrichota bacterium]NOG46186.1 STAS domain-containing protein [Calditrichota bacterium]
MEKIQIDSKFADKNGEIMIVELGGHVDQSNSFQLQKMFDDIIDSRVFKVIVDFSSLHYMSSAGWGIFVGEVKRFRENGGDIRLAAMNPEINDVYQMLEFYHILDDFPTVEEAAASFESDSDVLDIVDENEGALPIANMDSHIDPESSEIDIKDSAQEDIDEKSQQKETAEVIEMIPSTSPQSGTGKYTDEFNPSPIKTDVKLAELPLAEKVKRVVSENPLVSSWQIKKILKHEHFGHTKIGIFKLLKLLKELDLNSREKRYRYYRSC